VRVAPDDAVDHHEHTDGLGLVVQVIERARPGADRASLVEV